MRVTVKMPRVADSVTEVAVVQVDVAVGQEVRAGQTALVVETDKTTVDVPTPVAGTVLEVLVAVDDEVPYGAPVLVVDASGAEDA